MLSNISQVYPLIIHGIYECYPIYMEVYPWFIPGLYTRYTNVFRLYHVLMISNVYGAGFRSSLRDTADLPPPIDQQSEDEDHQAAKDSGSKGLCHCWLSQTPRRAGKTPVHWVDCQLHLMPTSTKAHYSTIAISMWRVRPVFDTRPTRLWVNERSKSSESQWVKIFILGLSHGYTMFKPCINSVYPFRNHPSHVSVPYRQIWRGDPGQSAWIWSCWSRWEFQRLHLTGLNSQVPLTACGSSTHIASTTQCFNICQPSLLSG